MTWLHLIPPFAWYWQAAVMEEKLIIFVLQRTGLRDFILAGHKNTDMTEQFMKDDKQRVR